MTSLRDAQSTAHRLLASQGVYSPLELLIETNALAYDDRRAWRTGSRRTLDDVLAGGVDGTRRLLQELERWARSLALRGTLAPAYGIEDHAGTELVASADADLDALLRTEYRPQPEGRRQKDLFLDTSDAQAANVLVRAIQSSKLAEAEKHLARLRRLNAGHWMLPSAEVLVKAVAAPPPMARDEALHQMEALERHWLPAASKVLHSSARDFVTPLWRRIAQTLDDGAPFAPASPKEHASFAFWKGLDWENVRRSVTLISNHRSEPALLEPLAEAEWRRQNRPEALALWFRLCWLAPDRFAEAMHANRIPDAALRNSWERLQDQDWQGPNTAAWLPAWMPLEEPGIARRFEPTNGSSAPEQAFDALLRLKAGGANDRDIQDRRKLQQLHPGLFDCFLASLK